MQGKFIPIPVNLFAQRCLFLLIAILILQFIHLNGIAEAPLKHNIVWFGIGALSVSLILLIQSTIADKVEWPRIDPVLFSILYVAAFLSVIIFSRLEYIVSFLQYGLYQTRANQELGGGGIYSGLTAMFYPLAIILVFVELKSRTRYLFLAMLACVVVIDFIFLGTRNAPVFVLLFHLLTVRKRLLSAQSLVIGFIIITVFVILFEWQSQERSLDTTTLRGWDWRNTLQHSWLMDHLPISEATLDVIGNNAEFLFPVVFLMQYLSHSIAVMSDLLSINSFDLTGSAPYLRDQFCILLKCDRDATLAQIQALNPSAGLYQTLYASLLFDFGWFGAFLLGGVFLAYSSFRQNKRAHEISAFTIYILVVLAVSSIENYFYNGLTILRFVLFLMLVGLLSNVKIQIQQRVRTHEEY